MKVLPVPTNDIVRHERVGTRVKRTLSVPVVAAMILVGFSHAQSPSAQSSDARAEGFGSTSRSAYEGEQMDLESVNGEEDLDSSSRGRMSGTKWGTLSAGDTFGSVDLDAVGENVGSLVESIGKEIKRSTAGMAETGNNADKPAGPKAPAGHGTAEIDTNSDSP